MLIVPLHRPLTAANFPYATALLILLNVLVFVGWQLGDNKVLVNAANYYQSVDLAQYEFPAYEHWRQQHGGDAIESSADDDMPSGLRTLLGIQNDDAFLAALRADQVITPSDEAYESWKPLRKEFDRLWNLSFTERHLLRYSEFDVGRMFTGMFLHGGFGHLFGNMLFLAFLGLLVEGALGSRQYLLLYLLGGLGGQLATLAWRWGQTGGSLGASGAIAGLMGAYCVLWGTRKVRVFWWFFVVFDYVRVPALALLPFWLGWQVLSMLTDSNAGVSFECHAGGIVSGALLALVAVQLGRTRINFLDEDETSASNGDEDYRRAFEHLGKLEIAPAKALLSPWLQADTPDLRYLLAWYRCCRYEPGMPNLLAAARRVLLSPGVDASSRRELLAIDRDYRSAAQGRAALDDAELLQLAQRWLQAGAIGDAEMLMHNLDGRNDLPSLSELWLQLANGLRAGGEMARARKICQDIVQKFPGTLAAQKANFLLSAEPG